MYKTKHFYKGEMIFKENSAGNHAYIIKEGKVEISKAFGDKSLVLEVLGQGEIFGEMALVSNLTHDGRPIPQNQAKNRRVVIVVTPQA